MFISFQLESVERVIYNVLMNTNVYMDVIFVMDTHSVLTNLMKMKISVKVSSKL